MRIAREGSRRSQYLRCNKQKAKKYLQARNDHHIYSVPCRCVQSYRVAAGETELGTGLEPPG
jgi:hypothetical protein